MSSDNIGIRDGESLRAETETDETDSRFETAKDVAWTLLTPTAQFRTVAAYGVVTWMVGLISALLGMHVSFVFGLPALLITVFIVPALIFAGAVVAIIKVQRYLNATE